MLQGAVEQSNPGLNSLPPSTIRHSASEESTQEEPMRQQAPGAQEMPPQSRPVPGKATPLIELQPPMVVLVQLPPMQHAVLTFRQSAEVQLAPLK